MGVNSHLFGTVYISGISNSLTPYQLPEIVRCGSTSGTILTYDVDGDVSVIDDVIFSGWETHSLMDSINYLISHSRLTTGCGSRLL